MNKIEHSLKQIFDEERIVLWYGGKEAAEMESEFNAVVLPEVNKIKVEHDEFRIKYLVLRKAPKEKFLLFFPYARPENEHNWLLDLCLANHVFTTDASAMYLQELGLDMAFKPLVSKHIAFFQAKDRRAALQRLTRPAEETPQRYAQKIIAATLGTPPDAEAMLLELLSEAAGGQEQPGFQDLEKYALLPPLWEALRRRFGYQHESPSILDVAKALFQTETSPLLERETPRLNNDALVFMKRWKDSASKKEAFEWFSRRFAEEWHVQDWVMDSPVQDLLDYDTYEAFDQQIIRQIRDNLLSDQPDYKKMLGYINRRRFTYWAETYEAHYKALEHAILFLQDQDKLDLHFDDAPDAAQRYSKQLYQIDMRYRNFILSFQQAGEQGLLLELQEKIERLYTNRFLLRLGDRWQEALGNAAGLKRIGIRQQRQFWKEAVQPFLDRDNRIFVIISDALRYESGAELTDRLMQVSRFEASLEPMVAAAPTYTQLGMAALLPHEKLELKPDGVVWADGVSTQGTRNRDKILKQAAQGKAIAITAADFKKAASPSHTGRKWVAPYQVVYIYSNTIDKAGEQEEEKVFRRTEEEFEHIIELLTKIANINGNNVLITADHGYLYQYTPIAESDFSNVKVQGDIHKQDRRFVLGQGLSAEKGVTLSAAAELELDGNLEVAFSNSVNRMRQSGSGSRYVHGGLSLQECLVPLIHFKKTRNKADEIRGVDVELIKTVSRITTYQVVLSFYQTQPVGGKARPRTLRISFVAPSGKLISDAQQVVFGSTATEERLREQKLTFQFTQEAEQFQNQEVYLRMEDESGSRYQEYAFTMLIAFDKDFDEFDL